jgi:hypothetical protein
MAFPTKSLLRISPRRVLCADVDFTTEHKSKQGDTRITVRTKTDKPVVIQAPQNRSCFVATACFGDYVGVARSLG